MAASPVLALPPLGETFGALFVGIVVSSMLFGVTCLQLYDCFIPHAGLVILLKVDADIYSINAFLRKA
jgi:hypothetical protein